MNVIMLGITGIYIYIYNLLIICVSSSTWLQILLIGLLTYSLMPNLRQYYMSEPQTWNHHITSYEKDDSNIRVLSFRVKPATVSGCLILIFMEHTTYTRQIVNAYN